MKRILALILAITTCLSLAACGKSKEQKKEDSAPEEIALNYENFKLYFDVSCSYGELDKHSSLGISFAYVDTIIDIRQVAAGTLNNVQLTLKVILPSGWELSSEDPAYSSAENAHGYTSFTVDLKMPASGEYSETHRIGKMLENSKPAEDCSIYILSASGTFTESK